MFLPPLILLLVTTPIISAIHPPPLLPFSPPHLDANTSSSSSSPLIPRSSSDDNCPPTFLSCTTLSPAYGAACCSSTAVCALDNAQNIACCPIGAFCTGILSSSPSTTAPPAASTVSNSYFPYPYIPTSFADAAACTSYSTACDENYAACTADLGGGFGVTIVVPGGGGVTVAPAQTGAAGGTNGGGVPVGDVPSVCSSLSSVACKGAEGGCGQWGSATGTATPTDAGDAEGFVVASTASGNGAAGARGRPPRVTGFVGVGMGVGMGIGVGVGLGMM